MRGVKPLPEAVRSSMRSGVILYDLPRVVEELVFNSLDAAATKVSVFVGVGTCYVKVVDDGCGIARDGLVLLGERYATSKSDQFSATDTASESFGFRGEALASISDVSLVEILTKASGRPNGYRKVMKGCKCLYLGIDDDRKDAGTTVVVRDLFYNQPVRRKYMQSSPKKVLHSVKKCVHRIALVHSKVSFKVVDVESSEDVLLRTIPSPSPLALLNRAFGVEISAALHELNISNGKLELSGYLSSPLNSITVKAFQYVYINSRFICKGPIHKLLNQLASSFECWDPGKTFDGSQNRKRSRPQAFPAYVLNLSCPRSFYDLTFEPSKTYVEFKDWVPVLTFVDKVIQNFWKEKIFDGESGRHGADMVEEDQLWKEGDNVVSADENLIDADLPEVSKFGKKRSWIQSCHASPDLMEMLIEDNHASQKGHVRMPNGYLHENTEEIKGFKQQHSETEFGHHTDYSFQLRDDHLAKCMLTETRKKESDPWMSDINFFSTEDYIMGRRSAAAERSSNVEENIFSSAWQDEPFKVDGSVGNGSAGSGVSCDHLEFSSNVEFTKDLVQPFLKSCSSKGRFLSERALCTDGGIKFQTDGIGSKRRRSGSYNSVEIPEIDGSKIFDFSSRSSWREEESSARPFPRVITKFELYTEFDSPSRAFVKSIPPYGEHFDGESSFMSVENIGSCHKTISNEWCSVTSTPSSQNTYLDFELFSNKKPVQGRYRSVEGATNKYFVDGEEKDCRFSSDIVAQSSSREHCTTNTDSGLDFNDYSGSRKFLEQQTLDCEFSPERQDILDDETDWSCWYSGSNDNMGIDVYKRQKDQFGYQDFLKNHVSIGRSKRSHSAPPFYRSKRRFFTLNHPVTATTGRPDAETFHDAATYSEASKMKDLHQSSGGCHLNLKLSSAEDSSLDSRYEESQDIKAGVNKMCEVEMFEQSKCSEIPAIAQIKEFISKDQDSLNFGIKWRNCCPQISNSSKMQGLQDQNNILDISSGFLYLTAGSLIPESMNKNCLKDCRVLQQVDKKFIAVMAGRTLALIDQHAADERIRLEELRQKVLSGEARAITFLDVEQELVLPEIGYQLLQNYAKPVEEWGWLCNIHAEGSGSFNRNLNLLHRQPTVTTLTAVPCILGVDLSDSDLMEFLQQLADTDGSSTMPPSVLRILNSKACRGAIMFGDSLLPSECSLIVEELKKTSLCFQCAHGRPTTAPLVNLDALHKQIAKMASLNDDADHLWHGLRRHELSLARAEQRLSLAKR